VPMPDLFTSLDEEWLRYLRRRSVQRFVDRLGDDPSTRFPTADHLVKEIRRSGLMHPQRADELLLAVMGDGTSNPVGQRIILQALLPGLCAVIRRLAAGEIPSMVDEIPGEVLSLAGLRIASYPLDRRPARVAANVLRDVERDYLRFRHRRMRELLPCRFDDEPDRDGGGRGVPDIRAANAFACVEQRMDLLDTLARATQAGVVAARDLAFVVWTRGADRDIDSMASDHALSPDSARRARDRAERRLSAFCCEAAIASAAA